MSTDHTSGGDDRDAFGALVGIAAVIVGQTHDGQLIEPDVYYTLRDGKITKENEQ